MLHRDREGEECAPFPAVRRIARKRRAPRTVPAKNRRQCEAAHTPSEFEELFVWGSSQLVQQRLRFLQNRRTEALR